MVARVERDHHIVRQLIAQLRKCDPHVEFPVPAIGRFGIGEVIGVQLFAPYVPCLSAAQIDTVQCSSDRDRCGGNPQIRRIDAPDLIGVGIDMDQPRVRVGRLHGGVGFGRHFSQSRTDHHEEVRLTLMRVKAGRGGGAEIACKDRREVVHDVLPPERGGDRNFVGLGKAGDGRRTLIRPARAAEEKQRPFGLRDLGLEHIEAIGRQPRMGGRIGPGIGHGNHLGQHVLGQGDHHRAGAARGRYAERAGHIFRHPRRVVDLGGPFGNGAEHGAVVDFLKGFAVGRVAGDLAHEQDHRRAVLLRDMHADGRVAGPGATGDHADAGLARKLAIGLGHIGGPGFVPRVDEGETVLHVMQRIQHLKVAFAGHAIGGVGTVDQQLIHKDLSAGPRLKGSFLQHGEGSVSFILGFKYGSPVGSSGWGSGPFGRPK